MPMLNLSSCSDGERAPLIHERKQYKRPDERRYAQFFRLLRYPVAMLALTVLVGSVVYVGARCLHLRGANTGLRLDESPDRIHSLPGVPKDYQTAMYSGYLTLSNGGQAFYYFAVSQSETPEKDPLLLWLNGGPGASSLAGCFTENGPLLVNDDGESLRMNEYAWNKRANLLCIESPVGVGFSYNASGAYVSDDLSQAQDLYEALQQFLGMYPWLRMNDLIISGESYGGVYVPTTARAIVQGNLNGKNPRINLKKFVVGNGVNEFSGFSIVLVAYYHGLISTSDYQNIREHCPDFHEFARTGSLFGDSSTSGCGSVVMKVLAQLVMDRINGYDIYGRCSGSMLEDVEKLVQAIMAPDIGFPHPIGNPLNLCLNYSEAIKYFNTPGVQHALHVKQEITRWDNGALTSASLKVSASLTGIKIASVNQTKYLDYTGTVKQQVTPIWRYLLDHNVEGVIYHGDADILCDMISGLWAVESLKRPRQAQRRPWFVTVDGSKQNGGFVEEFDGITYLTVRGAGHMVPKSKPAQAEALLNRFVLN